MPDPIANPHTRLRPEPPMRTWQFEIDGAIGTDPHAGSVEARDWAEARESVIDSLPWLDFADPAIVVWCPPEPRPVRKARRIP